LRRWKTRRTGLLPFLFHLASSPSDPENQTRLGHGREREREREKETLQVPAPADVSRIVPRRRLPARTAGKRNPVQSKILWLIHRNARLLDIPKFHRDTRATIRFHLRRFKCPEETGDCRRCAHFQTIIWKIANRSYILRTSIT